MGCDKCERAQLCFGGAARYLGALVLGLALLLL